MASTFEDFLDALLAFESGWDRERYDQGIIQDWQLDQWAGGTVDSFFPQYTSWSQLSAAEWEAMAYQSMNSLGFVGYQFGEALLIDLGYYDDDFYYGNGAAANTWDGAWTGKNGVNSLEDFMTAGAQDVAIREAFGHNLKIIEDGLAAAGKSLDDFLGTTGTYMQNGVAVTVTLTLTGILAAAHLRGAYAAVDLLLDGALSADEYGTSILQYVAQFGGYDAPTSAELIAYHDDRLTGDEGLGSPGSGDAPGGNAGNGTAGVTAETADVVVTWAWGTHAEVAGFDPATGTIFVDWFDADQIELSETADGVVFAIPSNNQTVTLLGIGLADLSPANFTIMHETTAAGILGIVGSGDGGAGDGTGDDPATGGGDPDDGGNPVDPAAGLGHGTAGVTAATADVVLTWAWGSHDVVTGFDPAHHTIFVDWFNDAQIDIAENGGSVVFTMPGNNQSLTLSGVALADLSEANFTVLDATAAAEILGAIGDGSGGHDHGGYGGGTPTTGDGAYPIVYDSDGSDPPAVSGTTDAGGVRYRVDYNADDIVGFDPARDGLDVGDTSVHNLIALKTPDGELGFDNPWGPEMQILQGVQFADLSIEALGVVGNEHLRQDIGGVFSWELGVGPRDANTVYIRSHEYGVNTVIDDFDPATMTISFLYYGTRERLSVEDTDQGLVISTLPSGQSFTFTGLALADLQPGNLAFHHDQVIEDNLEVPFGFSQDDVTLVSRELLLTPEGPAGQITDGYQTRVGVGAPGGDAPPVGDPPDGGGDDPQDGGGDGGGASQGGGGPGGADGVADTYHLTWNWAAVEVISGFAAGEDVLDFGSLSADIVAISESGDDLLIEVLGNGGHVYVIEDVQAEDLTADDLAAPGWSQVLTASGGVYQQLAALGATDLA